MTIFSHKLLNITSLVFFSIFISAYDIHASLSSEYLELRAKGERMSREKISEYRDMIVTLFESDSADDIETIRSLYKFPITFSAGLKKLGESYTWETVCLIGDKFLDEVHGRDLKKKYDGKSDKDRLFFRKYTLYNSILREVLAIYSESKEFELCMKIIERHIDIPIVEIRRVITNYLIDIYNCEGLDPRIKNNAEPLFIRLIEKETSVLNDKIDNKDFTNTDSVSRNLLEMLKAKKRNPDPSIKIQAIPSQ